MNNSNAKKSLIHANHKPAVTRRDFLAQGLFKISALTLMPSLGFLSPSQAEAACVASGWAPGNIPFFVIDLAGGAAMSGNFLVGKKGGPEDLLASYDTLGWNPRAAGALDKRFGLPMAAGGVSKMLQGILETASPLALSKMKMGSICHFSQADTGNMNRHSAMVLVSESGLNGTLLGTGLGTRASPSGGSQGVPIAKPAYQPLQMRSYEDLQGSVSYGTVLNKNLTPKVVGAMAKAIARLNEKQNLKLAGVNNGAILGNALNCGFAKNINLAYPSPINLDPRLDPVVAKIFGLTSTTSSISEEVILATIAMNTLKGTTGPGCLGLGGFDYHTGDAIAGDLADLGAGRKLGMIVELAHLMNQAFMFQIVTDGGIGSERGTRNWYTDTSNTVTVVGYYNPGGVTLRPKIQIGNFTDGQGADGATIVGSSTSRVAYVVFANYLNACGKIGKFREFVTEGQFPTPAGGLDEILIFS